MREPSTEASGEAAHIPLTPPPVPDQGVWVGPVEEPARYERLEHVDGGAEGVVYRARFVGLGSTSTRLVALKELHRPADAPRQWPNDGTWLRLSDQVGLLTGLPAHPHLVRVLGAFLGAVSSTVTDRHVNSAAKSFHTPYLVMEWIEGLSPTQVLAVRDAPLAERCAWVRDLASAVDLLQSVSRTESNPLVHGDIKPGNCLITADRGLVLVDTGAMTRLDATDTHRGLCTPPYAAPEVLSAPGRPRGTAADLFSLGAVAYLLLTGNPPPVADAQDYVDRARAHLEAHAFPGIKDAAARRARQLLLDYLSPEPADRARTGPLPWSRELAVALSPERPMPSGRLRRVAIAAAGIAALATGTAGVYYGAGPNAPHTKSQQVPRIGQDVGGAFVPFGREYINFPATVDDRNLSINTPTGADMFDHLWGFYLPGDLCSATVDFDVTVHPAGDGANYGIGVAPRSTLESDQPIGYSVQYEWEGADVTDQPGSYVRPSGLPAGAWAIEVPPTRARDFSKKRHVKVTALGTALTIAVDGDQTTYELPEPSCGGVALRAWGADVQFANVRVSGT